MTDIPFEIPESWEWVKLGDVCIFFNGFAFNSKKFETEGIPIIRISNIGYGSVNLFNCVYSKDSLGSNFEVVKGDLLIAMSGATTGKMGIYNITPRQICIGRGLCGLKPLFNMNSNFWFYFLQFLKNYFEENATGTTFKSINGNLVSNALIPLPPLAEQKRIVDRIEEIFASLDEISLHLV